MSIAETMSGYSAAFNAGDVSRMASYLHVPLLLLWSEGPPRALVTLREAESFCSDVIEAMQKQDFGRSEVIELHTRELGPRYGMASWSFVRRDKAGREIGRLGGTYTLISTVDGWKIASIMLHPFEAVIRL